MQERSYAPGWLDRLTDRIARLPGPYWVYAIALLVAEELWVTTVLSWNGRVPEGLVDLRQTFVVAVAPYMLCVRYYLDGVAGRAMDTFRPALSVSDDEFRRLRYELTTLPAGITWAMTAFAAVSYVVNAILLPDWIVLQFGASRLESALALAPVALFTMAVVGISTAQAIRQLWMVDLIHGLAARISLFGTRSVYAFSGLTARTGVCFLLLAYYVAAARPDVVFDTPVLKLLVVAMVPTAIACFVLPLRGMHLRLAAERDRLYGEAGARLERLLARLHERVDEGTLADADKLNSQLASVQIEREALANVSTWPWNGATLTGFLTTLVLPLIVWLAQRLLDRLGL